MQFEPSLFCSSFGLMCLVYFPFGQVASPLACFIETLLAKWYSSIHAFYHMLLTGDTFDGFFQWIDSLFNILLTAFSCNRPAESFCGPTEKAVHIFETFAAAKGGLCTCWL